MSDILTPLPDRDRDVDLAFVVSKTHAAIADVGDRANVTLLELILADCLPGRFGQLLDAVRNLKTENFGRAVQPH